MISQKKKKLSLIIFLYGIFNIQRKNYQEGYLAGDKKNSFKSSCPYIPLGPRDVRIASAKALAA